MVRATVRARVRERVGTRVMVRTRVRAGVMFRTRNRAGVRETFLSEQEKNKKYNKMFPIFKQYLIRLDSN